MKTPGTALRAAQRKDERLTQELALELSIWWKRLDIDRPLSDKERGQLQKVLSAARTNLMK